jgi:hypothetical protein
VKERAPSAASTPRHFTVLTAQSCHRDDPLTLADRVRVVAAMLPTMQDDIYAGRYSEPGRPNVTTIQHVLFESSEDLDSSREEMDKILDENRGIDAEVCRALWPEETKS